MSAEPRYESTDDDMQYCQDCGSAVIDEHAHTRFHSILGAHAWALAVLQTAHITATSHDKYEVDDRINSKRFDSWSADALTDVISRDAIADEIEAAIGTGRPDDIQVGLRAAAAIARGGTPQTHPDDCYCPTCSDERIHGTPQTTTDDVEICAVLAAALTGPTAGAVCACGHLFVQHCLGSYECDQCNCHVPERTPNDEAETVLRRLRARGYDIVSNEPDKYDRPARRTMP